MAAIGTIIQKNSIVKRLIAEGDISILHLKRIYRRLCKMTHPDLRKEDGSGFIRLKEEYEEALASIGELRTHLSGDVSGSILTNDDVRRMFYEALRHYLAAGLHSMRMRIKSAIKTRNELILREVLYWANLYRPAFVPLFLEYNRTYLRRFTEWQKRDNLSKAQKLLLSGIYNITDYEKNTSPQALRAARSFFSDCQGSCAIVPDGMTVRALAAMAQWFADELELLAARKKTMKHPVTEEAEGQVKEGEADPGTASIGSNGIKETGSKT